jgi:GntR family transcriptional regulator
VTLRLTLDPAAATPIWSQIEEGVKRLVSSAKLGPGAAMPSVRALAAELLVNPATVAKAYQRLADAGLLVVKRGEGTFVAERPPAMSRAARQRILRDAAERYVGAAHGVGAGPEETMAVVAALLDANQAARAAQGGKP